MRRWQSDCCNAEVDMVGNIPNYYTCRLCGELCDLYEPPRFKNKRNDEQDNQSS